jgi:hypothetical protein
MTMNPRVTAGGRSINSRRAKAIDGRNHNTTLANGLRVRTAVNAGRITANHNETLVSGGRIRTTLKAGRMTANLNPARAGRITVQE